MISDFILFRKYDLSIFITVVTLMLPAIIYFAKNKLVPLTLYFIGNIIYNLLIILAASDDFRMVLIYLEFVFWFFAAYFIGIKMNGRLSKEHFYIMYIVLPTIIPAGLFVIYTIIHGTDIRHLASNNYLMFTHLIFTMANLTYTSAICFLYIKKNDELMI